MRKREEIEYKYRWDLSHIYKSREDFDADFEKYKNMSSSIPNYKGKLTNIDTFLEYLKLDDELDYIGGKIGLYVFLNRDMDISNSKSVELLDMVSTFQNKVSAMSSFVEPEILSFSNEYLNTIYSDVRFKDYVLSIKDIVKNKEHILDDKTEALLTRAGEFASGFSDYEMNMTKKDLNQ